MVILIAGHHSQREIYPIRPTTPWCFKNGINATEDIETANTPCTVFSVFYSPTLLFHRKSVKPNNTGRSERHHGANRDFCINIRLFKRRTRMWPKVWASSLTEFVVCCL